MIRLNSQRTILPIIIGNWYKSGSVRLAGWMTFDGAVTLAQKTNSFTPIDTSIHFPERCGGRSRRKLIHGNGTRRI